MESRYFKYFIWFVVTLFVAYAFCLNTASAVFSQSIKSSLNLGSFDVSIASGAFILGYALMQIPAGYLLDKFNARYVVSAGVLLLALGNIAITLTHHLIFFAFFNFIQGVGASFSFIAAAVLISQWFSVKSFPILFGLTQTISCISAGIVHYYFTSALTMYSWSTIYRVLAIVGVILLILTLLIIRSPVGTSAPSKLSLRDSLKIVLKNPQILLCAAACATSFGVLLAYASLWYMPIQSFYAVDTLQAVGVSGMLFAGLGIGTPILGWLSNYVQSRLLILHMSLVLGTMALLLCIYLPHFNIDTLLIIKTISFLTGFFLSGSMLFYTMVSEISTPATRGVAVSVVNTCVYLFNTLLLFIPYLFITAISPQFFTYLWILPFFILLSILLLYFIKK